MVHIFKSDRVNKRNVFNVPIGTKTNVILPTDDFQSISAILSDAMILSQDFEDTLDLTVRGDFVFVDPPYTVKHNHNGFLKYNDNIFSWEDQIRNCPCGQPWCESVTHKCQPPHHC